MFLRLLTLTLCLTNALVYGEFKETTVAVNYSTEPLYNVHEWVTKLQLERCAFVGIGLKLFAIFVEDEILGENKKGLRKYFLGVCQESTLEQWNLCSPELAKKRKHKCSFKLSPYKFRSRVHRRFCDLKVMVNNKDCICDPTIFGDDMQKVKGFPTCFIPPLPGSLCRYNTCGISKCQATTVEDRIYSVECDSKCKGENPFCEYPIDRTSTAPVVKSSWSKWRETNDTESRKMTGRKHSVATCINKYTGKGDVDCLGPGTGCCSRTENCTCDTSEENGTLRVERIVYEDHKEFHQREKRSYKDEVIHHHHHRHHHHHDHFKPKGKLNLVQIDKDSEHDIEDDEDDGGDLDEDIVLEEHVEEISRQRMPDTLEKGEREEVVRELINDLEEEATATTNNSSTLKFKIIGSHSSCIILLIILRLFYQEIN